MELWHKKDAALFEVHINKRKGNKAKAAEGAGDGWNQIEKEVAHKKKYLTRFTKMILNGELDMYVKRQMVAVITAFSEYAACSSVSYAEQLPVWSVLGKEVATNFEELESKYKEEYAKLRGCA